MWEIRDVKVCRINRAIFVGEADDIARLGAKPENLRFAPTFYATQYSVVREHFELLQNSSLTLLALSKAAMSKYGVLVMGPAGAGKVCAFLNVSYTPFPKQNPRRPFALP